MGTAWDIDAAEGRGVLTVNYGIEGDDFDPLTQVFPPPPLPPSPSTHSTLLRKPTASLIALLDHQVFCSNYYDGVDGNKA